jgi:hypothetical protein
VRGVDSVCMGERGKRSKIITFILPLTSIASAAAGQIISLNKSRCPKYFYNQQVVVAIIFAFWGRFSQFLPVLGLFWPVLA